MADDDLTLVCVRTADLPTPRVPSFRGLCARCLATVWRSARSEGWVGPIVCIQCALADPRDFEGRPAPWVRDDLAEVGTLRAAAASLVRRRLD